MINAVLIFGAQYLYLFIMGVAGFYFFTLPRRTQKQILVLGISVAVVSYALAKLAGVFYYDPRPFALNHIPPLIPHSPDNGFPSDHTLLCAVIASVLFPFNKKLSMGLWILTLAVGFSRVYAGVHHPIDILGSIIIVIVVTKLAHKVLRYRSKSIQP